MDNQGIHPRVVNGRTTGPKVNTTRNPDKAVAARTAAAIEAHLENHPRDTVSRHHLDKVRAKL